MDSNEILRLEVSPSIVIREEKALQDDISYYLTSDDFGNLSLLPVHFD